MFRKLAIRFAMTGLTAFGLASSMGSGCSITPTLFDDADDCGPVKHVCVVKTIRAGTINGQSDYFELETPEARNDCHAEYSFQFRWADPLRRISDPDMPPLENLARAFQPGGEFAYFPHIAPIYSPDGQFANCNGLTQERGFWVIQFSTGNQNSPNKTTRYYVGTRLDPALAGSLDDTEIYCRINYYDKPKKP